MLELLNDIQPWINFTIALAAGSIGLWAGIQQRRLLEGDALLVRALVLRLLFLGLYVSWAIKALHHLREWRRTIASLQ